MSVSQRDIKKALLELGLKDKYVEVHSSLSSFGHVDGGADTVIAAISEVTKCSIYPSFSERVHTLPTDYQKYKRNGLFLELIERNSWLGEEYSLDTQIDRDIGIIPITVKQMKSSFRSNHPTRSWVGIGDGSEEILKDHTHKDLHTPLIKLSELDSYVLMIGVDLVNCTALHLAEEMAGRKHFIRWFRNGNEILDVEEGGDSSGFENLQVKLETITKRIRVGEAELRCYPLKDLLEMGSHEIRLYPEITRCSVDCPSCEDSISGGPYKDE